MCCVVLCDVMCCAVCVLWCDVMCCAVMWCAVLCVLCCAVIWCAVMCCAVMWCDVMCCAVLAVLCVLCCDVMCCAVLCCAVIWCDVMCCAVLCCAVLYLAPMCAIVSELKQDGENVRRNVLRPIWEKSECRWDMRSLISEAKSRHMYTDSKCFPTFYKWLYSLANLSFFTIFNNLQLIINLARKWHALYWYSCTTLLWFDSLTTLILVYLPRP